MKKLILSTLLCCALNTQSQTPIDTTKAPTVLVTEKPKKKKMFGRTWDKVSLGIFVVVTTYFFLKAKQ